MKFVVASTLLLFVVAGCAPVVVGGPPMPLPPGLRDAARLGSITVSSEWLDAEDDFSDTFASELAEELGRCMQGAEPLDVRIHLDRLERADRVESLLSGEGMHLLSGTVEFVDRRNTGAVAGRFPISVATTAGGPLEAAFGDRQMMVSEEFGRALCSEAFGRNPRGSRWTDATRG